MTEAGRTAPGARRPVEFNVGTGECIRAHFYRPASPGPWPAVLVSHGAIGAKEEFEPLAEHLLGAGFAVLVPDMRGHGESDGPRYHVALDHWVGDLGAAMTWLGAQPEIDASRIGGLGFSSGGTALLELAAVDRHGLAALVTLDATVRSILSPLETRVFLALGALGRLKRRWLGTDLHLPLYPLVRRTPAACDPAVNAAILNDPHIRAAYWRYPIPGALDSFIVTTLDRIGRIDVPVCVIHGEADRIDGPDSARALFQGLTGEKSLHIIPGSGHAGHRDQARTAIFQLAARWFERWLG